MPTQESDPTSEPASNDDARSFARVFDRLQALIVDEWPAVSREALAATGGDLDKVAAIVAESAGRTKTLAKRQLRELVSLVDDAKGASGDEVARLRARVEDFVSDLETRSKEIVAAGGEFEKEARKRVEANPWTSLLVALGLGFILGIFLRDRR